MLGSPADDAQGFASLLEREPGKEADLHQLAPGVDLCEAAKSIIKVDQIVGRRVVGNKAVEIERRAAPAATSFLALGVACTVEQDRPHGLGGSSEKVAATVPGLARIRPDDPKVGFVNTRGGLESLARILHR